MTEPLCGVWVDDEGNVQVCVATPDGGRITRTEHLRPFAWLNTAVTAAPIEGVMIEALNGPGPFNRLVHAENQTTYEVFLKAAKETGSVDAVKPMESQFLLQRRARLFSDLSFTQLRRCQLDIETASSGGEFSDASKPTDCVLAIGLRFGERIRLLVLDEESPAGERRLLEQLNTVLAEEDPDVIEGHNIFKFDLDYLRQRGTKLKVPCAWGRFGQKASFRNSRLKIAERWIDFPRCDLPGRTVVDTYLLVQQYDITTRELASYRLKEVAVYFGITNSDSARTYLAGDKIHAAFTDNRTQFLAYLADDLRETKGVADLLLPTYFEQVRTFPILMQEATLRGTTGKIDLLFLEHYFHARQACPVPPEITAFEGGYTRSFKEGVFRHILHFDVASLYPSILMAIGRNPSNDPLGVFMPMLTTLREYRHGLLF